MQNIAITFRPLITAAGPTANYAWEIFYKLDAAVAVQGALVLGTDGSGNFPFGKYNANQAADRTKVGHGHHAVVHWPLVANNVGICTIEGCYDNMVGSAVAGGTSFGKDLTFGTSYISDSYAKDNGVWSQLKTLCQTRCTIADTLGFYSGVLKAVADPPAAPPVGLVSVNGTADWNYSDMPLVVQLPNLPITGYLGGGASAQGGATALPVLGIIDGFKIDETPSLSISSPYNENWIKLLNKDSFTINEMQVRITDMYGVLPDYLDNPSHVWVKIRAGVGNVTV